MRKFLLALLAMVLFSVANSQHSNRCGSNEVIKQQMSVDPAYAKKVNELLKNKGNYSRATSNSDYVN